MRVCRTCGGLKESSEFPRRTDNGRLDTQCRGCRARAAVARRYGTTVSALASLLAAQGHRCGICKTNARDLTPHPRYRHSRMVVDHDHATGRVRGFLCHHCNLLLGHARDHTGVLARAAEYLSRPAP